MQALCEDGTVDGLFRDHTFIGVRFANRSITANTTSTIV
jgi:hypothetical protein